MFLACSDVLGNKREDVFRGDYDFKSGIMLIILGNLYVCMWSPITT